MDVIRKMCDELPPTWAWQLLEVLKLWAEDQKNIPPLNCPKIEGMLKQINRLWGRRRTAKLRMDLHNRFKEEGLKKSLKISAKSKKMRYY